VDIREIDSARYGEWDAFVRAVPAGTFFHLTGWKDVMEKSFRHRTYLLSAEESGAIIGVLPLVHIKSRLFGSSLISMAFCTYGGPIGTPDAIAALDERARALAAELDVDYLEYRSLERSFPAYKCKDNLYVTFRKPISADHEANLKAIPRKQRAMVRKGIGFELHSDIDSSPERLYRIYSESVRNLGTPVFPKALFNNLTETFGENCDVVTITHKGQTLASVMNFYFRDEVLPYYGGSVLAAREVAANDFMYWDVMRRAADRGYRTFDYGRSKLGTGSYSFKKNWGFEPQPLHYEFHLRRGDELPDISPKNPKYQAMIAVWKKLPLPIANFIGPFISPALG
jgi:FemAB-related protein (PEP-CTERM system-associated)